VLGEKRDPEQKDEGCRQICAAEVVSNADDKQCEDDEEEAGEDYPLAGRLGGRAWGQDRTWATPLRNPLWPSNAVVTGGGSVILIFPITFRLRPVRDAGSAGGSAIARMVLCRYPARTGFKALSESRFNPVAVTVSR
jgi:hypothetical protein